MQEKIEVLRQIYENLDDLGRVKMTLIMEGFSKSTKPSEQEKQPVGDFQYSQIKSGKIGGKK